MTIPSEDARSASVFSRRMVMALLMGFYSGLPLLLTGSLLQAWMREAGVDLATIGLFALVGLPYTGKFLWAPIFDRYALPWFGRRRGWLLLIQLLLAAAIASLGWMDPGRAPLGVAVAALLVTFFSASQDIVIDAYRRESLLDLEQGLGASLYVNGYRLGMLLASGGGLILADFLGFQRVYGLCGLLMATGALVTLWAREPASPVSPKTLREAVVLPFLEFFRRRDAIWILLFILLYKLGDTMASNMTMPFYLDLGFGKTEIGAVVKLFGFWATVVGGLLGGVLILKLGVYFALWLFGVLQAVSTAGFALLAHFGPTLSGLTLVISFENLSGGMGTAAFVAFMASQTDKRFTATQYALLSSLMGIPRVIVASPTGYFAEWLGWEGFFVFCALIALPGMLVLLRFRRWLGVESPA